MLEFRILGPFEVAVQQRPVALGGHKQRALLAILLLARGEVVSRDRLIDQLWGERPPASAAKIVQVYVSHLRKALGSDVLVTRGGGYVLVAEPGQIDADRFAAIADDARRALADGDGARARGLLGAALELWRGEALADLAYEPFAQGEIARLEEARRVVLEDRIDADLLLGHHRSLVGELESLVARDPHRERLLAALMLALYRSGRQAEALEAYHRGRQALNEELGLEPGPALRALEQRILTQDPELDPPTPARGLSRGESSSASRGRTLIAAGGALVLAAAIAALIVELTAGGVVGLQVQPNSVAVLDASTDRVAGQVPVGTRPGAIAFGSGALWVANLDDQTISRVDPRTLRTSQLVTVGEPPTGVAAAGGAVWVVDSSPTASYVTVSRIDPQFDAIRPAARIGNVVPGAPGVAAAQGTSLWVAPSSGDLTRLDVHTGAPVQHVDPNGAPAAIAVGDGAVWVTDNEAGNVIRVDSTGLVGPPIAVGPQPTGIAVGDGAVWVADAGDNSIVRIDPATRAVTTTIPVGDSPSGVAIGAGSVWVADTGDGTVTRIDPATDKPIATIAVGGAPQSIVFADGRVWVTVDARSLPVGGVAPSGGTLRVDFRYDVDSMDPALAFSGLSWQLL